MMELFDSARVLLHGRVPIVLFDTAIKGALILMLATILVFALRRASASLRHLVWSLSIAALVALPFLSGLAPRWAVPSLPTLEPAASAPAAQPTPSSEPSESASPEAAPFTAPPPGQWEANPKTTSDVSFVSRSVDGRGVDRAAADGTASTNASAQDRAAQSASAIEPLPVSTPAPTRSSAAESAAAGAAATGRDLALTWTTWAALLWAAVALVVLAGIGLGIARTWLIARTARRLSGGALVRLAEELSARLGLKRRVSLLQSRGHGMPLTWGLLRPKLLLPSNAVAWPTARLRAVLLHELSHVKRYDYLTQLLARLACALHWFNPLVWYAASKLQEERELACDDQVLRSGSLPSEYAAHLLDLARSLKAEPLSSLAAVAMARPSQLGDRLRAVLDEGRPRAKLSGRAKLSAAVFTALIVIPIAGASPGVELRDDRATGESADEPTKPDLIPVSSLPAQPRLYPALTPRIGPLRSADLPTAQLPGCDWFSDEGQSSTSVSIDDDRMKVDMRRGDCELRVDLDGQLVFNESFTEIASLSRGGELEIEEKRGRESRRLILEQDGGRLTRAWYVNRDERPYDADARAWLSDVLLVLFRRAGLQATERAEYILAQDGVDGLLREISRIPSDYTARKYYTVLLARARLEPDQVREIVRQAGREIDSDHQLAEMLIAVAENQPLDESVRIAYVEAAGSIDSDHEHRRVLSAILTRQDLSSELAQAMLLSAASIDSDHELAELLIEIVQLRPLDDAMADAFYEAVSSLDSSFETRRVLEAALRAGAPDPRALDLTLRAAAGIDSSHELARLLVRMADVYPMDAQLPESYAEAARSIDSSSELGRALTALLSKRELRPATVASILDVAAGIDSDHELGKVLAAVARDHTIGEPVRPAYFRAADAISSDSQRQRVLVTVLREQTLDDPLAEAVLESALEIDSDHQLSRLLLELLDRYPVGPDLRPAFDRAVESIDSRHERDRVLSAIPGQQSARM